MGQEQTRSITRAELQRHANLLRGAGHLLALEFAGLDQGARYELAFSRLLKPDPRRLFLGEAAGPLMLGTDQRDRLVPLLRDLLQALPPGGEVLDVGAGDGQTTAHGLATREAALSLTPADREPAYLEQYRRHLAEHCPQVRVRAGLQVEIDALFADPRVGSDYDAILALHSLYFASDPARFLGDALDRLKRGGGLVAVIAEGSGRFATRILLDYLDAVGLTTERAERSRRIDLLDGLFGLKAPEPSAQACSASLRQLLGRADIKVVRYERQTTRIYGHDFRDLLAAAFITGLSDGDDHDMARRIGLVIDSLLADPAAVDLRLTLEGPRAGMLSVAQPQLVAIVERI
ncbi:MAG: hypothetical protein Kilf2KO_04010 [Rhodospirillales bacterium]